ncbi:MAG: T9SS type A sorting domain-containing protein, partial [Gammaproteobacteria bacterium]
INEEIAGGSNATIGLQWDAAQELPGFDRSQSRIGHYIGGSWQLAGAGAAAGSNPYNWSGSGYTSFSPFGVLNSNATLPLLKITFNVVSVPAGNQCTWMVTGGDIESIVLQRSLNGRDFVDVHSAAFSLSDNFTDAIRNATKTFYRLKIIDKNASVKYSNIVWLDSRLVSNPQLYPTLFTQSFFVQYQGYGKALIKIYNESGSMVQQNQLKEGTNEINAARLPSGAYFYQIVKEQNVLTNGQVFKQ